MTEISPGRSPEEPFRFARDNLVRAQPGDFELRFEDNQPTMVGHFAVFNQWTEINSRSEGHFMERIMPGAFARTFSNNPSRIRVTFQHGKDPTLGDQVIGIPSVLEEDEYGARYEVPLFEGVPPLLVNGLTHNAYGSSFRFRVLKDDRNERAKPSAWNPNAIPERSITEAEVMEFGPVTYPAYEGATAGVRSQTDEYLLTLIRGIGDALPQVGPEETHSDDEGTREAMPPTLIVPRFHSEEDWFRYLKES